MSRWPRRASKIDPVLQGAHAECGLACVAMILRHAGAEHTLAELRERWSVGLRAISLRQLIQIFGDYGISGRPIKTSLDGLRRIKYPAILHWDFGHYVVLERATTKYLEIVDPAVGRRRITAREASRHFTGVTLELEITACAPRTATDRRESAIQLLLPDLRAQLIAAVPTLLVSITVSLAALVLPLFLKVGFERLIPDRSLPLIHQTALLFAIVACAHLLLQLSRVGHMAKVRARLTQTMAQALFRKLIYAKASFFEERPANRLASQYQAVQSISSVMTEQILTNGVDILFVVLGVALLLATDLLIGATFAIGILAFFAFQLAAMRETNARLGASIQAELTENGYVFETMDSMSAVKVYGAASERISSWHNVHGETARAQSLYWSYLEGFRAKQEWLGNLTWISTVYLSICHNLAGYISVGTVAAIASWGGFILVRAREVARGALAAASLRTHFARIDDIIHAPDETRTATTSSCGGNVGPVLDEVGLDELWFRYSVFSPWILKGCSLTARSGELVGITAPSGTGKSTLIKLMVGLLEPASGTIAAGSCRETGAAVARIRSNAGVVLQNDVLVTGTILDNITFFDVEPDLNRAAECARLACIDDVIEGQPLGYGALVGRRGAGFSAGQIQRLLLARALYRDPDVLLLDEFSANMDEALEAQILSNLQQLKKIIIVVAHRPQVLSACSKIFSLKDGNLVEQPCASSPSMDSMMRAECHSVAAPFSSLL
ncbi:peptidase domain-containing ABC transporter [Sphingomonas pokkalii]|uniref:ABC transporter n=1 Tax=Sphingomonas pokkalii TaxID=2175090 RepID=A0A2U0SC39_9SPHN|nr:peptidase domain-containing ABC transporter [Sphingomonas pokkalii]PVX28851.1 hypothetical protein DD559_05500 [Sphingomonas pokkalii]